MFGYQWHEFMKDEMHSVFFLSLGTDPADADYVSCDNNDVAFL